MDISLIWAMAENGVIGRDSSLPWRLPKDMQFFKAATMGKPVIMGRKTFETLKVPLPGRTNIVMTRDQSLQRALEKSLQRALEKSLQRADEKSLQRADEKSLQQAPEAGIKVVDNFAAALKVAKAQCEVDGVSEIMVAGGAEIYRLGLAVATRLYVTRVHAELEGDTWFPEVDWSSWEVARIETFEADEKHSHPFSISVYNRRP
jgi:dihydrofolate reductase